MTVGTRAQLVPVERTWYKIEYTAQYIPGLAALISEPLGALVGKVVWVFMHEGGNGQGMI